MLAGQNTGGEFGHVRCFKAVWRRGICEEAGAPEQRTLAIDTGGLWSELGRAECLPVRRNAAPHFLTRTLQLRRRWRDGRDGCWRE